MRLIDRDEVRARLTWDLCIPVVRRAMMALSSGQTKQLLRSFLPLTDGRLFGIMPGALGERAAFGAKLISVFAENFAKGVPSHQGVVVLFDPDTGAVQCVADAGEVTALRTAAASAVATDALARPDATTLALLGYGEQAATHLHALKTVRPLRRVRVWGRSPERAAAFARRMTLEAGVEVVAVPSAREAVADADVICTLTAAKEPILESAWVRDGTHLNVVGSSYPGPVEIDSALVVRARFVADSREGILQQGAEFLVAKAAGLVTDAHVVAEIGEVLSGAIVGRQSREQVTLYKSIGHIVQDLASVQALYETAQR